MINNKNVFAYVRVSTARQGQQGVSLQEQRAAIEAYAARTSLVITRWFEERQTAAKRGRPIFTTMLRALRAHQAGGVVMHKIDRSARNLRDWADLGELADVGIQVHFANETLDLRSRGGRLSADIQAVVAADYIRNLREESRKGFYGRLKQGLYPLPAPVGYLDAGRGNPKRVDPTLGPLVRTIFELYATGRYTYQTLSDEINGRGFRTRRGAALRKSTLGFILNNPFYAGLIRIGSTGESFRGLHEPLVARSTFDRVQELLRGPSPHLPTPQGHHDLVFRRVLTCGACGCTIIGERQKGHVYYRCHTLSCRGTSVREDVIERAFLETITPVQLDERDKAHALAVAESLGVEWGRQIDSALQATRLQLDGLATRLSRLTDAFLDQLLDRPAFENRRELLLAEEQRLQERLRRTQAGEDDPSGDLACFLELCSALYSAYSWGVPAERRRIVLAVTSNRTLERKQPRFALSPPFEWIATGTGDQGGSPYRNDYRTWDALIPKLFEYFREHPGEIPTIRGQFESDQEAA